MNWLVEIMKTCTGGNYYNVNRYMMAYTYICTATQFLIQNHTGLGILHVVQVMAYPYPKYSDVNFRKASWRPPSEGMFTYTSWIHGSEKLKLCRIVM